MARGHALRVFIMVPILVVSSTALLFPVTGSIGLLALLLAMVGLALTVRIQTVRATRRMRASGADTRMHATWANLLAFRLKDAPLGHHVLQSAHLFPTLWHDDPLEETGFFTTSNPHGLDIIDTDSDPTLQRAVFETRQAALEATFPSLWDKRAYALSCGLKHITIPLPNVPAMSNHALVAFVKTLPPYNTGAAQQAA